MSLFGAKPAGTGFSFGQPAPAGATAPGAGNTATGSLFGGFGAKPTASTASAPASGSLFGQQPQQQQQQQSGTSLFGQPQQQQQPAAGNTGSLFGQGFGGSTATAPKPATGGLFGTGTTTGATSTGGGLFGNTSTTTAQQPASTTFGGFGTNKVGGAPSFGLGQSSTQPFQQQQQQQQSQQSQQQPQQLPPWSSGSGIQLEQVFQVDIPGDMLFEDIEKKFPGTAKAILMIEEALQKERKVKESIDVKELGNKLTQDRTDINILSSGMQVHQHAIKSLRTRVDLLNSSTEEILNVWQTCVEVLKTAHEQKASGGSMMPQHATFYREFFSKLAVRLKGEMDQYRRTIEQIERQLIGMSRTSHVPSPQAVAQTVSNNQNTILGLASDLSGLEERIRSLADYYRQTYRSKMNTVVDPFVIARAEAGQPPLGYSGKRGERGLTDDIGGLKMG